jgi:prepilin-type N-terminal cleavage/methylation domain-containing protein
MLKKKGFTLVELLVVISIIALLVSILMPSLNKAKEIAYRMKCSTNMSAVGKALGLYRSLFGDKNPMSLDSAHSSNYPVQWPFNWGKPGETTVITGYNREEDNGPTDNADFRCVTSLMWMLVRSGNTPKIFVCPSDGDVSPQPDAKVKYIDPNSADNDLVYCWDFSDDKNVSYSWQSPKQGVAMWPGQLPIMADKTPVYTLGVAGCYLKPWADGMAELNRRQNMSQNHTSGEEINVLRTDGRVSREGRADINDLTFPQDCIYTYFTTYPDHSDARSSCQLDPGSQPFGQVDLITAGVTDSFLIGPY